MINPLFLCYLCGHCLYYVGTSSKVEKQTRRYKMHDYKITYGYTDSDKTYSYEIMANDEKAVVSNLKENANPKYVSLIKIIEVVEV